MDTQNNVAKVQSLILNVKENQLKASEDKVKALEAELEKAKLDENKLKELEADLEKAKLYENKLKELEAELEKANQELGNKVQELEADNKALRDKLEADKKKLENEVQGLKSQLEEANQAKQELQTQLEKAKQELEIAQDQANQANGELQTQLEEAKLLYENKLKALEDKVKELEDELKKAATDKQALEADKKKLENEVQGLKSQLDQANQAKQELQTQLEKAKQELETAQKEVYQGLIEVNEELNERRRLEDMLYQANQGLENKYISAISSLLNNTLYNEITDAGLESALNTDITAYLNGNGFNFQDQLISLVNKVPQAFNILSDVINKIKNQVKPEYALKLFKIQKDLYYVSSVSAEDVESKALRALKNYLGDEDNPAQERYALSKNIFDNIINIANLDKDEKARMLIFFVDNFNDLKFNNLLSFGVEREEYRVATKKLLIEYLEIVRDYSQIFGLNQKAFFPILKSVTKYLNQEEYNEIVSLLKANATNQQKQSDFVMKPTTSAASTDDVNTGIDLNPVGDTTTKSLPDYIMEFQKDYRKNYKSKSPILLTMIVTSMTPLFFSLYILNKRNVIDVTTMGIAMFACAIIAFVAIYSAKKRFSDLKERNNEAFWIKFKLAISMTLSVLSLTVLGLGVNEILATSTSINSPVDLFDFFEKTIPSFFSELGQNKEVLGIAITALVVLLLFAVIATPVYTYKLHSFGKREEEKINDKVQKMSMENPLYKLDREEEEINDKVKRNILESDVGDDKDSEFNPTVRIYNFNSRNPNKTLGLKDTTIGGKSDSSFDIPRERSTSSN